MLFLTYKMNQVVISICNRVSFRYNTNNTPAHPFLHFCYMHPRQINTPPPPLLWNILRIQFFSDIEKVIWIRQSMSLHSSMRTALQVNTAIDNNIRPTSRLTCPNNHHLPRTKRFLKSFKQCLLLWKNMARRVESVT